MPAAAIMPERLNHNDVTKTATNKFDLSPYSYQYNGRTLQRAANFKNDQANAH
jgi:hypothetical protein